MYIDSRYGRQNISRFIEVKLEILNDNRRQRRESHDIRRLDATEHEWGPIKSMKPVGTCNRKVIGGNAAANDANRFTKPLREKYTTVHVSFPPCFLPPSICAPGLKNDRELRNDDMADWCGIARKLKAFMSLSIARCNVILPPRR